jgi:hypothetical protein
MIPFSVDANNIPHVPGFHPENLPSVLGRLRNNSTTASFCLNTFNCPLSGKQCLIYVPKFPDSVKWAVRIPIHIYHWPPETITENVKMEVLILKRLEASGFEWSPKLVGYDVGFENGIGFPYQVLSWVEGRMVEWSDTVPAERRNRHRVLRQMADIMLQLAERTQQSSTLTLFHGLRLGPVS